MYNGSKFVLAVLHINLHYCYRVKIKGIACGQRRLNIHTSVLSHDLGMHVMVLCIQKGSICARIAGT